MHYLHSSYGSFYTKRPRESEFDPTKSKKIKIDEQAQDTDLVKTLRKIDLFCHEKIEQLNEEIPTQTHSVEPARDPHPPLFNINTLTITELLQFLHNDPESSSIERYQNLSNLFTHVPSNDPQEKEYKQMWLKIPKGHFFPAQQKCWLNLMIVQDVYTSQCFAEKELNFDINNFSYFYINASIENDEEKLCFQIRLDPWISTSEILHVEKIQELSGNQVKSICLSILNYLNPTYVYLNDDSKITLSSNKTIELRVLLPIVNNEPKTWYTSDGFTLLPFSQLESPSATILENQNHEDYIQAVDKIRNTPLSSVTHAKLPLWKRRYLNAYYGTSFTLSDLGKAMYKKSRGYGKADDIRTQQQANFDLSEFYDAFLTQHASLSDEYLKAISTLQNYKLWYKHQG